MNFHNHIIVQSVHFFYPTDRFQLGVLCYYDSKSSIPQHNCGPLLWFQFLFNGRNFYLTYLQIRGKKPNKKEKNPERELTCLVAKYSQSAYNKEKFFTILNTRKKEIEIAELILYNEKIRGRNLTNIYINYDDDGSMATCIMNHPFAIGMTLNI